MTPLVPIIGAVALASGLFFAFGENKGEILKRMTASTAASQNKIDNSPSSKDDEIRLLWLDKRRAEIEAILKQRWPNARMTSAYRNEQVNKAVGGSSTSRHRLGLGLDFGWGASDYLDALKHVRDNTKGLTSPRTVIAETTPPHLHMDYNDPLNVLDKTPQPTKWLWEKNNDDKFVTV